MTDFKVPKSRRVVATHQCPDCGSHTADERAQGAWLCSACYAAGTVIDGVLYVSHRTAIAEATPVRNRDVERHYKPGQPPAVDMTQVRFKLRLQREREARQREERAARRAERRGQ